MQNWWDGYPWRMIQTNLREIDMADIKADVFVEKLKEFEATVVLLNAAGIIASYGTALDCHFQSPFLTGDSLATIIDACHAAGIKVIARTDFSKIRRPVYEKHPEWAYISPKGGIVDYNGDVHACVNGGYQQDYAFRIIEEVLTKLPFDGIFFNMGGYVVEDYSYVYHGICQCDACRKRFRDMFCLPLPKEENPDDPVFRKYVVFKERTLAAFDEKVTSFIRGIRPDICIDHAKKLGAGFMRQESNTALKRPLPHWQFSASDNTRRVVTSYPGVVSSNTTVDFIDFPIRHVAVSPAQQELRLAQNLANGGALDYYIIGRLDNHADRSGFEPVKSMFRHHKKHEELYRDSVSAARIVLLADAGKNQDEYRGWFRFLAENHFPFDTLYLSKADRENLSRYALVILPGLEVVDDSAAGILDGYVAAGGNLVVSGLGGCRDAMHEMREAPALECLGLRKILKIRTDIEGTYFRFDSHEGFPRSFDTDLVYFYGIYVYAEYADDVRGRLNMVSPHMFGPPERCYYTQVLDHHAFTVRNHGKGRAFHFPWLPGTIFHRQGYVNTSVFITDFLESFAGAQAVATDLPPSVELTVFRKLDGTETQVRLVNASGHFGTTFYPPIRLSDAGFSLPCPEKPADVRLVVSEGAGPEWSWVEGVLTVRIHETGLFEVVRIVY